MIEIIDVMSKVQELKLEAWKGGYLSGSGRSEAARAKQPVMQKTIDEIRLLLIGYQGQIRENKPHRQAPPKNHCQ